MHLRAGVALPSSFSIRALALVAAGALLAALCVAAPAAAVEDVTPARIEGATRVDTAAEIALRRADAEVAVIARADAFPDALAGAALAGAVMDVDGGSLTEAPILLTYPDRLPAETTAALDDLGVERVVLLGGLSAISAEVSAQLEADYTVDRVAGANRYETSVEIARRVFANVGLGTIGGQTTVLVASGDNFPDALAAGPAAYDAQLPILLTATGTVPESVVDGLEELDPDQVVILGGTAAVSQGIEDTIAGLGINVSRLAGATRTHTAAMIADWSVDVLNFDARNVVLARGDDFPDALAAGPHAGDLAAPMVITTNSTTLGDPTEQWLQDRCATVEVVQAVGGQAAVATVVLEHAEQSAEVCGADGAQPDPSQDYLVAPQEAITVPPETAVDFRVSTFDGDDLVGPFTLALFPCANVDATGSPKVFADGDSDGRADGIGTTGTGNARIALLNGVDIADSTHLTNVAVAANGTVRFTLFSFEEDCTVPVIFSDTNGNGELNLNADGTVVEPFGLGQASWETGDDDGGNQALRVDPAVPVNEAVGSPYSFRVTERGADGLDNPADLAVFPCGNVTVGETTTFADANDDGIADGLGTTATNRTLIALVNGVDIPDVAHFQDADPGDDGFARFTVANVTGPDCATVVAFQDVGPANGLLDVDDAGAPVEPFGVGQITYVEGD